METKDVILELRTKKGLSQDELAEKVYVTRQAVSRWENGETIPNTETLKLLSGFFDVSINTLLGSPRQLICQCCGMPLDDSTISKEPDGTFNEEYCKWCYTDGKFTYDNIDDLIAFCVEHMDVLVLQGKRAIIQRDGFYRTFGRKNVPRKSRYLQGQCAEQQAKAQKQGYKFFHVASSSCFCFCFSRSCSRIQTTVSTTAAANAATPTST